MSMTIIIITIAIKLPRHQRWILQTTCHQNIITCKIQDHEFFINRSTWCATNKKRQEEGDLIGPTLVTMENKNSNSSKSKKLSSNNKKGSAESPVQIVKVEGSNCLRSQGGALTNILVSIAP